MSRSNLVAVAFEDQNSARDYLDELYRLQKEQLLVLEGVAVMEIDDNGRPTIQRPETLAEKGLVAGAVVGGAVGTLVGALALSPIIGGVLGTSIGSVGAAGLGALTEAAFEDGFMTDMAKQLKPGSSALFVQASTDRLPAVLAEMKPPGGKVITTTLDSSNAEKLQEALEGKLDDLMG